MEQGKRCAKCGETKPRDEFGPGKKWSDGLHPYCRPCKRESDRRSYARHASRRGAAAAARYAANPEPAKARSRARYRRDPQRWIAEVAAYDKAHPERKRQRQKRWQQANMQGLVREAVRRRYATRKGARAIRFTPDQLMARGAFYGFSCWVCRAPMTEWDHVKPLSVGGWHCLSNLRPICRGCNARKRNTWPFDGLTT